MSGKKLNATSASLLGLLHETPMTGWDLVARAHERIGGFWSLTQSQVYRELAAMATDGLVEAGERGARDRRPYSITDAGREAFRAWLDRTPDGETIRFPLLLYIMFGRHVPAGWLAEVVARGRRVHTDRLADYLRLMDDAVRDGGDPYRTALLDFGVRYEQATLSWFDALPPEIRGELGRPRARP